MGNINPTVCTNGFFGSFLKSPIQMGSLSVDNSVTNFSSLGTFNVPLTITMRDIIFFCRQTYFMGYFKVYLEGAKTFLNPRLSRAQRGSI
jgi:hypothetical protein